MDSKDGHEAKDAEDAPPTSVADQEEQESKMADAALVPLMALRKPKVPPPPESFGLLPDNFQLDAERVLMRSRPPTAINEAELLAKKAAEEEAARRAAKEAEEKAKRDAEREAREEEEDKKAGRKGRRKRKGGYVPPPPPQPPPKPAKILGGVVPRGRLQIKLNRAVNVGVNTGMGSKIDFDTTGSLYLKWELVMGGGQPIIEEEATTAKTTPIVRLSQKSQVYKDVTISDWAPPGNKGGTEETDPGMVIFSYSNGVPAIPMPDALPEEDKAKLPPLLFYSVWWTGLGFMKHDELIAEGVIQATPLLVKGVGKWNDVCLPLFPPGQAEPGGKTLDPSPASYLLTSIKFTQTYAGILTLTLHDGRGLRHINRFEGKNNVYVRVTVGDWEGKHPPHAGLPTPVMTSTIQEGGTDPTFGDQELLVWVDHPAVLSGLPIVLSVWDESSMGRDTLLGKHIVPMLEWTGDLMQHSDVLALHDPKHPGTDGGAISITRKWHPAGELCVRVVAGRNMVTKDALGGNDSYIELILEGRTRTYKEKTGVAMNSGGDPQFQEQFVFDVVDHAEMKVESWDKDMFTRNDLIGEVIVDLANVFRYGVRDGWVPMKLKGEWGGYEDRGELRLECDFSGPSGVSYPQLRPDQEAFNESERISRLGLSAEAQDLAEKARLAKEAEIKAEREMALRELAGEDYRDADIEKAFQACDIDGNLVITAGELRHLLICMGELITDAEVDEMVNMCDKDGDGTVAFYEFYQMAKTSLPTMSAKDWRPAQEGDFRAAVSGPAVKPPPIVIYGPDGKPLQVIDASAGADARKRAMQRAQDLAKKAEKKILCERLCKLQSLRLPELQRIFRRFTSMPQYEEGFVTTAELMQLFDADPKGPDADMWKELFAVFSRPGVGRVHVRELLLALNNFTGATKPQRVNFAFFLFDVDESGELSRAEIVEILRANHLAADDASVQSKAATIMAAADRNASDSVSLEEFVVIASRFPNVLFPNFAMSTDEALEKVGMGSAPVVEGERPSTAVMAAKATDEQAKAYAGDATLKQGLQQASMASNR